MRIRQSLATAILGTVIFAMLAPVASGQDKGEMGVQWAKDFTSVKATFRGQGVAFPDAIAGATANFPEPGDKPSIDIQESWPSVTMIARWSMPTGGWPKEYRDAALGYVLMCGCDADLMAKLYPAMIAEGRFTAPLQFRKEAVDLTDRNILKAFRGQELSYEVLAKGGFGAADYTIKTKVRVGLSEDGKTVFYYDSPEEISDHLADREILFAAHDAGDRVLVEMRVVCVMAPRSLFRDTALGRVRDANQYFIDQLFGLCSVAPSKAQLDAYTELLKKKNPDLADLLERAEAARAKAANEPGATTSPASHKP